MKRTFDAVKFQREVREALSKQYTSDPKGFVKELRKEYGGARKRRVGVRAK